MIWPFIGLLLIILSCTVLWRFSLFLFIIALPLGMVIRITGLRTSFVLGAFGEARISRLIKKNFNHNWYLINDVKIPAQIDHILICPKGVFTIETKNYTGKIYGSEYKDQWSKYVRGREYKFYSRVKQGKKHSLVVSQTLSGLGIDISVKTIVVFHSRWAKLKVHSPKVPVLYSDQLVNYLSNQKDTLTPDRIQLITDKLKKHLQI